MHKVSPSQISNFRDCPRKWWYASIAKIPYPQHPSAALGERVHKILEMSTARKSRPADLLPAVSENTPQKEVQVAQAAWDAIDSFLLQQTGRSLVDREARIEEAWELPQGAPLTLAARGRADLVLPDFIVDWKTTSDLRWAKSAKELRSDPQVLMYSAALDPDEPVRDFVHVYTQTRNSTAARVVHTPIDRFMREQGLIALDKHVAAMAVCASAGAAEEVEPNTDACSRYGGCPFALRCMGRPKGEGSMSKSKSDPFAARRAANVNPTQPNDPPSMNLGSAPVPDSVPVAASKKAITGDYVELPAHPPGKHFQPTPPTNEEGSQLRRVLYLGCAPQRGSRTPSVWFDEWVAPLAKQAAESQSVAHYSCADYGQGKAALLALVTAKAQAGDIPQSLIVDRRLPAADACVEVLLPHYHVVIGKLG